MRQVIMSSPAVQKQDLRREMRRLRSMLSSPERAEFSRQIVERLTNLYLAIFESILKERQSELRIAGFLATPSEPDIDEFLRALQQQSTHAYAPCVSSGEPRFGLIQNDWANLQTDEKRWRQVTEYSVAEPVSSLEMNLILVPGLAFDAGGARLGQGGGWYDKALTDACESTRLVGVCFDFQLVEKLPRENHDVAMHAIVTPTRTINCRPDSSIQ